MHARVNALESKEIVSAMGSTSLCLHSGRARAVALASHSTMAFHDTPNSAAAVRDSWVGGVCTGIEPEPEPVLQAQCRPPPVYRCQRPSRVHCQVPLATQRFQDSRRLLFCRNQGTHRSCFRQGPRLPRSFMHQGWTPPSPHRLRAQKPSSKSASQPPNCTPFSLGCVGLRCLICLVIRPPPDRLN